MTQDFDDTARAGHEPEGQYRYKYNAGLDPTGGRVGGLNARLRSQGRDHIGQLDAFYDEGLISEVLYLVSIGKEASVYCCAAGEHLASDNSRRLAGWDPGGRKASHGQESRPVPTPPRSSFESLRTSGSDRKSVV